MPIPKGAVERMTLGHLAEYANLLPPDYIPWIGSEGSHGIHSVSYAPSWPLGDPDGKPVLLINEDWRAKSNILITPIEGMDECKVRNKDTEIARIPARACAMDAVYFLAFYLEVLGTHPPYMAIFSNMRVAYERAEDGHGINVGIYWLPDNIEHLDESEACAYSFQIPFSA